MNLAPQIDQDLVEAMKAKDEQKLSTLRMLKAALKNAEIQKKGELDEGETLRTIQKEVKSRQDSIALYEQGGRGELAEKEKAEIEILQKYLPAQMSDEEIRAKIDAIIKETGAQSIQDMGKVMGKARAVFQGQADMGKVSQMVKERLQ